MNVIESYIATSPLGFSEECAKFTIDDLSYPFVLTAIVVPGREYTLSFWAKADTACSLHICDEQISVTTSWVKHVITFTASEQNISFQFGNTGVYYIYCPKLETGNKATDWTQAPEDIDDELTDHETELTNHASEIESVKTEMEIMADEISMNFTRSEEHIESVNGEFHSFVTQFSKYIKFTSETAITIGSGDSAITLEIDNETGIVFKKNGVQFGWWDGEDFHTGNIVVEVNERAQLGNYAFVPRSDGSLMLLKVGG